MHKRFGRALVWFTEHPVTRISIGLALLVAGADDLFESLTGTEGVLNVDVYHGVILLSVQHVAKGLGDLLEGMKTTVEHILPHASGE